MNNIVQTKDMVTTVAYLIGVRKNVVEQCFDSECHDLLQKLYQTQSATTLRYLCKLRTSLFKNFSQTDKEMRYNLKNLNTLDWFDSENIKQLEKWGVSIIKANYRAEKYMLDINEWINKYTEACRSLFPDWVEWKYIKELFCIPRYTSTSVMKSEADKFLKNQDIYPFQMYIYWSPFDCGSILMSDKKFLKTVYGFHNDTFIDATKFYDANNDTKNRIYDFIRSSSKVVIAVDCENSDVYKLYATLKGLDQNEIDKIDKIYLYDDPHTTSGWQLFEKYVSIPVQHSIIERVTERKSLVDIAMTAGICQSHYADGVDSFILVSSDSDFWGLITALKNAKFLVMYEYDICGQAIKNALSEHGYYYCAIDDFCSGNAEHFKRAVLLNLLSDYIPHLLQYNAKELVNLLYTDARINGSDTEKKAFYDRYIKTLSLRIDKDHNFYIDIKK